MTHILIRRGGYVKLEAEKAQMNDNPQKLEETRKSCPLQMSEGSRHCP
jgi:hypothetical protein